MAKNSETIIVAYKQANADASEILTYLDAISNPGELKEASLPSLVRNLESKDSTVATKYINCASIVGGTVATAVGTSVTTGILTSGMAVGGAMAVGGIGLGMIPGLSILTIPVLALPLAIKLLADAKVKRYVKENQASMKQKKTKLQKSKEKLINWLNDLQHRAAELDEKMREEVNKKFAEYKEKTKKLAQDVSIQIDDCLNVNTNKRILQYNEVILKQYKLQKDLEEKVDFLFDEYNKLLTERQELERQINCLVKILNAMGCPESVINQALNEEA